MDASHPAESGLPFTGERYVPGAKGEIWIEHWHRYHFAARWAAGRRVLDVACGEGYGTALLARSAAHATGIDVSEAAVAHARRTYGAQTNLAYARASCARLPLADASVDLAVSFETLEHIDAQEAFLDELARVLAPGGVLVLSCPNKLEYSDRRSYRNEFHVKELYREELEALVAPRFPERAWYGQRQTFYSVIAPESPAGALAHFVEVEEADPAATSAQLGHPLYFVLVAGRDALPAPAPALSVLADRGDWVHRDYEKVCRELEAAARRAGELEREAEDRATANAALRAELDEARRALAAAVEERNAAVALREAQLVARELQLSEKNREIDRRRSWRWWLKLPLIRLGILK